MVSGGVGEERGQLAPTADKIPWMGWLRHQTFASHSSGRWKADIRVSACVGSGSSPLPGFTHSCCLAVSSHTERRGEQAVWSLLMRVSNPIVGLPLMTSSNPNYPLKAPSPNTITWEVGGLTHDLVGMRGTIQFTEEEKTTR